MRACRRCRRDQQEGLSATEEESAHRVPRGTGWAGCSHSPTGTGRRTCRTAGCSGAGRRALRFGRETRWPRVPPSAPSPRAQTRKGEWRAWRGVSQRRLRRACRHEPRPRAGLAAPALAAAGIPADRFRPSKLGLRSRPSPRLAACCPLRSLARTHLPSTRAERKKRQRYKSRTLACTDLRQPPIDRQ